MPNITKKALESSLKKLMLKKPLDKITIRDVTEDPSARPEPTP